MNALDFILKHEGFRAKPYYDSLGFPTIGYGQLIGVKGAPLEHYNFSISEELARAWADEHLRKIERQVYELVGFMDSRVRYAALYSMAYQLGFKGLSNFKNMIAAIKAGDYDLAAMEALDSRWAKQTPSRALETANMLRSGEWP